MKNFCIKRFLWALILILTPGFAAGEEGEHYFAFDFTGSLTLQRLYPLIEGQPEPKIFYDDIRGVMDYRSPWFDILLDWGMTNEGLYTAEEKYFGGRYFALYDTRLNLHSPNGAFAFTAGRGPHKDAVDTPYSVFINSSDISAFHLEFTYKNDFFFFTDRWVPLNYRSKNSYLRESDTKKPSVKDSTPGSPYDNWEANYTGTWLDKGANYKTFGVQLGDWRIGFQDVVIYLHRHFDAELFFNPMPQYFVQLINSAAGRPASQAGNDKSFMGFFTDYYTGDTYGAAQLLIDDINPGKGTSIKTKIAWSLGGWKDFDFGRLGFYHAGATKYTFAATYTAPFYDNFPDDPGFIEVPHSILPYGATYAPATEYTTEDGDIMPIDYTENYFGYKYGENNIAFMVDYQHLFFRRTAYEFGLYTSLEYVLNGAKSPANPWHEYYGGDQIPGAAALLDGTVEHLIKLSLALRKPLGKYFILNLDVIGGLAVNAMNLKFVTPVEDEDIKYEGWFEPKIYLPQEGVVEPFLKVVIGATVHLPIRE